MDALANILFYGSLFLITFCVLYSMTPYAKRARARRLQRRQDKIMEQIESGEYVERQPIWPWLLGGAIIGWMIMDRFLDGL